jgi:phosphopantetheinyl transferase (holo-ACP synthase)
MLLFLASVLEQVDLALEHTAKGDVHNARFGLMLTDNAVELVLHQVAKDKASDLKSFSFLQKEYAHQDALNKALGRNFDAKVKFAKIEAGLSDETAQTITTLHRYRNEVYHVGLKHERILPALSVFYFDTTCGYLSGYKPRGLGWGSDQWRVGKSERFVRSQ